MTSDVGFDDLPPLTVADGGTVPPPENVPTMVPPTSVPVPAVVADDYDFGDDAGAGTEGLRMSEQLTPFIGIFQGLSPQINPSKAEYLPEARLGAMWNNATGAVYDGARGIEIMAAWREAVYTEWVPRDDIEYPEATLANGQVVRARVIKGGGGQGGFRGSHSPDEPIVKQAIQRAINLYGAKARFRPIPFYNNETKEEVVLIEGFNLGIIYGAPDLNESTARRAMIAFTSTKIGVYTRWLAAATDIKYPNPRWEPGSNSQPQFISPPLWAHRWRLTSVPQTNKKGDFFNFKFALAVPGSTKESLVPRRHPLYLMAKEFYEQWKDGQVKADYAAGGGDAAGAGDARGGLSDEVPF